MTTVKGLRERYCGTCEAFTPQRVIRKKLEWQCERCQKVLTAPRSRRSLKQRP